MELKTLKELSKCMKLPNGYVLLDFSLNKDLKQEAIKWFKAGRINKAVWRCFFNITEEDLK